MHAHAGIYRDREEKTVGQSVAVATKAKEESPGSAEHSTS